MGSAKWAAARKEGGEQREKRSQKRPPAEKMTGSEEGRGKRAEKGYKREGNGSVPDGRDGGEKGRPLGFHKRSRLVSVAFLVLVGIALVPLFWVDCHDVGSIWSGHRASAFMVPQGRL